MLRILVTCSAAVALLASWAGGATPASAQAERDLLCNPVLDGNGEPVMEDAGGVVTHDGTFDCPQEVAVVEEVAEVEPAAGPAPLPEGGTVYFPLDVAELTPEARETLQSIISDIDARDLQGITVAGHADRSGPAEYNMRLSQARAQNVAAELIRAGIPATVIETQAFGETQPAVPTEDGVVLQENRRVVVDFEWQPQAAPTS